MASVHESTRRLQQAAGQDQVINLDSDAGIVISLSNVTINLTDFVGPIGLGWI